MPDNAALVLFSGGQDSATCLAWALDRFDRVETIAFDYRQRHRSELDARDDFRHELEAMFPSWARKLGTDRVLDLSVLGEISETALTRDVEIIAEASGLPNTFVPGRNILFLTLAAAVAYRRGLKHIVTGVCETDFSGYPDCRDDTVKALQVALNLGMETRFVLETPLMWINKAQTWMLAHRLGGSPLVDLIRKSTVTCYQGDIATVHEWGRGCGECPACKLRERGFREFAESPVD
ncbi:MULTISPECIES: 7-cyano-7-deazaguanine synthase QueC [Bradyrhizobium]|nr:7-cyano-7-deazaguanine synthase QueC [Bradyrhizobium canariense]